MFNTLASYLLGTQQPTGGVEESNVRLTSVISEDDWVLVDRDTDSEDIIDRASEGDDYGDIEIHDDMDSVGNSDFSSMESLDRCSNLENYSNHQRIRLCSRSSSNTSLPLCNLEESWFVTPPPCFTSAGPVHMETSPLENLLIEHPSMSVYQHKFHIITPTDFRKAKVTPQVAEEEKVVEPMPERETIQRNTQIENPHAVIIALKQKEKEWLKNRSAQKVQLRKACQSLKRKYTERANKAREVNQRNRHQRRSERSQGATRSYANNNRKC